MVLHYTLISKMSVLPALRSISTGFVDDLYTGGLASQTTRDPGRTILAPGNAGVIRSAQAKHGRQMIGIRWAAISVCIGVVTLPTLEQVEQ